MLARRSIEPGEPRWVARPLPVAAPAATAPEAPRVLPARPPAPARVVLHFLSTPPGAETRRVGDPALLGLTPFSQAFDRQDGPAEFEMTLPGHEPLRLRARLDADATVGGSLKELARAPEKGKGARRAGPPRAPGGASKEATLNPFAK
jgi:hypothetical protein